MFDFAHCSPDRKVGKRGAVVRVQGGSPLSVIGRKGGFYIHGREKPGEIYRKRRGILATR